MEQGTSDGYYEEVRGVSIIIPFKAAGLSSGRA